MTGQSVSLTRCSRFNATPRFSVAPSNVGCGEGPGYCISGRELVFGFSCFSCQRRLELCEDGPCCLFVPDPPSLSCSWLPASNVRSTDRRRGGRAFGTKASSNGVVAVGAAVHERQPPGAAHQSPVYSLELLICQETSMDMHAESRCSIHISFVSCHVRLRA